jgi:hypothetical protein
MTVWPLPVHTRERVAQAHVRDDLAGPVGFGRLLEHGRSRFPSGGVRREGMLSLSLSLFLYFSLFLSSRPHGDLFRGAAGQLRAVGLRARHPHALRRATIVLLPGPEIAVFDGQALCAPIQKRHAKPIYYGERRSRFKRFLGGPGRCCTGSSRGQRGAPCLADGRRSQLDVPLCRFTVENHYGNIQGGA